MIWSFDRNNVLLRALWIASSLRSGFTDTSVRYITYRTLVTNSKSKLVQIALAAPNSDEAVVLFGVSDNSIQEAFEKAFSESQEARLCWQLNVDWQSSRSGFACADSFTLAFERAHAELVERDAFLMHLMVPELETKPLSGTGEGAGIVSVQLQSSDPSIQVVLAGIHAKTHWILGLGSGNDLDYAHKKAIQEALMIKKTFTSNCTSSSLRHACLSRHYESSKSHVVSQRLREIFECLGDKQSTVRVPATETYIQEKQSFSQKHNVVWCVNPSLLQLSFGDTWRASEDQITNLLRSRNLQPRPFLMHPLV